MRLFRKLAALPASCGILPVVGFCAVLGARLLPDVFFPPEPAPVAEVMPPDFEIIDGVLAKRAPDLGLTLRHQLGVAIGEEARKAGFDPLLIVSIIEVESDFDETAVSNKGARGLMQIQPTTLYFLAQKEGLKLSRDEVAADPALQVRLGIRYLRSLVDRFHRLDLALMAYNAGPGKIRRAMEGGREQGSITHAAQGGLEVFRRYPGLVRRQFKAFREGVGLGGDWALAQRDR